MTDMTAFERRVADGMLHRAGPIRPVDDLAVYEAVTVASRSHRSSFTMLSALRFAAAAIVLALFGGFLLAGLLTGPREEVLPAAVTESPSPSAAGELLPGVALDLEAVEPGVFRVDGDGVRDLARANNDDIVAGPDGSVWLLRPERFFRLGSDEWHEWPTSRSWDRDFEVAPEGTVWVHAGSAIQSFDGQEWTTRQSTDGVAGLEIAPDGTVWATWLSRSGVEVFGLLDEDGGRILDSPAGGLVPIDRGILSLLPVTDPDDIWATFNDGIGGSEVVRAVDGVWRRLVDVEGTEATWRRLDEQALGDSPEVGSLVADVGLDGTVWGVATFLDAAADSMENDLYRFDGSAWSRWSLHDIGFEPGPGDAQFKVAPDGSLWFGVREGPFGGTESSCDGVARFDGQTWDRHLAGLCVRAIDITSDGVVWLLAREPDADLRHVYVIDPETAAATRAEVDEPPEVEMDAKP